MSQIFDFSGSEEFYHGGSIYSNPKEAGSFLSLGIVNHVDVYFPNKRARISAPIVAGESVEQKKQVSLDVLPDECLFEIFTRLSGDQERSSCAGVSKRWLMLLSSIPSEDLCNKIKVAADEVEEIENDGFLTRSLEGKKATDVRLAAVAVGSAARGGLGKLMIRGNNSVRGVTDLGLKAVARCCPSLKSLSLWNVSSIGDEGLIEIANRCHRLEKIDLCNCPSITNKTLLAIAKNCPTLTSLSIEGCQYIGNEGVKSIGQFCPNLKSVTIKDCPLVGDQGVASLMASASFSVTKLKLQGLNVTDLSLAVVGHYGKAITDLVLTNLQNVNEKGFWIMGNAEGLQHLRSFTISSCRGVTDVAVEAVGKGCPNLKQFVLKKCAFISDNGLVSFAKAARSLESLQLEECHRITQIGFFGLLFNCGPKLKALTMSSCFGFKDMILGFPLPIKSTPLRSVTVSNCPGLGDMTLAMLAKLCPQLQCINFNGLPCITDAGLLSLIESCDAGAGLVKVGLTGCVNVTDNVVIALAKFHGGTLEVLNLEGCGKVTDAGLVAIADDCLLLNELDLSKCAITDFGVASLARSKQLCLQILSLSGCSMLSDKCLPFLVKLGQSLMGLNLQNCNSISSTVVDMLVQRLFRCDILS
ncbi:EIN3-binding F-box protein 1-like [Chenopodium quinoa]|uniref:EIN3-binding F-box protein 1-like n=1 Tax=Chenopodium quinoa TaxID=63459 RepID=UPI000B7765A2|nr:EIN3-binding F-box protein 1-like [Chenopodium quinoa]